MLAGAFARLGRHPNAEVTTCELALVRSSAVRVELSKRVRDTAHALVFEEILPR